MVFDQGTRIVEQDLLRNSAKMRERRFDTAQPRRLPLMGERHDKVAPRVTQGGDEQVHTHGLAPNQHVFLSKINLQLLARGRLKTHRGVRLGQ